MKTSWSETHYIELYLDKHLSAEDLIKFQDRMKRDPFLRLSVSLQSKMRAVVMLYARRKLKSKLQRIDDALFSDAGKISFKHDIESIFKT